jgi:hypothetical protein
MPTSYQAKTCLGPYTRVQYQEQAEYNGVESDPTPVSGKYESIQY